MKYGDRMDYFGRGFEKKRDFETRDCGGFGDNGPRDKPKGGRGFDEYGRENRQEDRNNRNDRPFVK